MDLVAEAAHVREHASDWPGGSQLHAAAGTASVDLRTADQLSSSRGEQRREGCATCDSTLAASIA